ncbi:hypothetical protein D3C81_1871930 [compost metagenome]
MVLHLLLFPVSAELVIQGEDGGIELFAAYRRGVAVEVFANRRWRNGRGRSHHPYIQPGSADIGIRLKDLGDNAIYLRRFLRFQSETLMLPALLLVLSSGPLPPPQVCRYCFSAVAWACTSTRLAMSAAVRSARK